MTSAPAGTTGISIVTVRNDVRAQLEAIAAFYTEHPDIPAPSVITAICNVSSRAELDGLAGDFGQAPPEPAMHYKGAQFSVTLTPYPQSASVIVSFHEPV